MNTSISMLRGINVSGKNRIMMAALKEVYLGLGFSNVVTYVQSGNVIFDSAEADAAELARTIEAAIKQSFGFDVPVILRDKSRFQQLLNNNPFTHARNEDPTKLHITFLSDVPTLGIPAIPDGCGDEFVLDDKELYLFCPGGYGETKLSNSFFERKLKVTATTRNWKTVNTLYEIASRGAVSAP
jgi:uncharacterized protein (DUF1697 family)